jgi:hypothetical protein
VGNADTVNITAANNILKDNKSQYPHFVVDQMSVYNPNIIKFMLKQIEHNKLKEAYDAAEFLKELNQDLNQAESEYDHVLRQMDAIRHFSKNETPLLSSQIEFDAFIKFITKDGVYQSVDISKITSYPQLQTTLWVLAYKVKHDFYSYKALVETFSKFEENGHIGIDILVSLLYVKKQHGSKVVSDIMPNFASKLEAFCSSNASAKAKENLKAVEKWCEL